MFYFLNINPYWFFTISYSSNDVQSFSEKRLELDQFEIVKILKELDSAKNEELYQELKAFFEAWSGLNYAKRRQTILKWAKKLLESKMELKDVLHRIKLFYMVMIKRSKDEHASNKANKAALEEDTNENFLWEKVCLLNVSQFIKEETKQDVPSVPKSHKVTNERTDKKSKEDDLSKGSAKKDNLIDKDTKRNQDSATKLKVDFSQKDEA